jgi:hypothetical protein
LVRELVRGLVREFVRGLVREFVRGLVREFVRGFVLRVDALVSYRTEYRLDINFAANHTGVRIGNHTRIDGSLLRVRLHVRFCVGIPVRIGVRFAAKGVHRVFFFAELCEQTIVIGDRKRIGSLFCLHTNRARNRTAIRTQIRTRVDGSLLNWFAYLDQCLHAERSIEQLSFLCFKLLRASILKYMESKQMTRFN